MSSRDTQRAWVSSREAYWLTVVADQAKKAVEAWSMGQSVDADLLSIQKHLRELAAVRLLAPPARGTGL